MIMEKIEKWGFGASPLKPKTKEKYEHSLNVVKNFFLDTSQSLNEELLICISTVKGLFNRCIRQDQWDWFTVSMYFDYPEKHEMNFIVSLLTGIRNELKALNILAAEVKIKAILKTNFIIYVDNFLSFDIMEDTDDYIYILSRKSQKELLKIGMTTRNVIKRCNEINSATGVVYPFSPRCVYRVKDARKAEHKVHEALNEYRIRSDREFFNVNYAYACKSIEKVLGEEDLLYYKYQREY